MSRTQDLCPNCNKKLHDGSHSKMDIIYCNAMWNLIQHANWGKEE